MRFKIQAEEDFIEIVIQADFVIDVTIVFPAIVKIIAHIEHQSDFLNG